MRASLVAFCVVFLAPILIAQRPGVAPAPYAIPNPTYVTIPLEITVDRPAAEVWKRVGKYCDISEWLQIPCTILSGDGGVGTLRSVGGEVLVGETELDAAREKDKAQRIATFTRALQNMKTLAEGGTLPPPPARGDGR